jgi:FKBP-type peptidyl-prolyl cis-trans isomerase
MNRPFQWLFAALGAVAVSVASARAEGEPAGGKPKIPDRVYVKMTTSKGDIYLALNQAKAPLTTANFMEYVRSGAYDGTLFHRVINNFMIQGGGFDTQRKQRPTRSPIKNEWQNGLKNVRGSIAMARLGGQADSATNQFFINVVDNPRLDQPADGAAYAVFGRVIKGMEAVDAIKAVPTRDEGGAFANIPNPVVVIEKVVPANPDELKKEIAAAEEEENRMMQAAAMPLEAGKNFVKSRGGDISRGSVSPSGLWHVDVAVGSGASPKPTDQVTVHYTGWLTNGTKFDSSVDRGQPATFGLNQVIRGWTEGVGGMKPGGKRFLVIPPDLAYGAGGRPPSIPPSSTLVFEVELIRIGG